jgi:cell division protein FtsL
MLKFILLTCTLILIFSIIFKKERKYKKKINHIYGCTYKNAINYNKKATKDNLSCAFNKKKSKNKLRIYSIDEHNLLNNNNKNVKKIITYQLIDKNNNIKNSKNDIVSSVENLLFNVYYDESNRHFKLILLNSFIIPIDIPDNLYLNELELSLFKDNNKISFNNNKFIIINNGKEIINIDVSYNIIRTQDFSLIVNPFNRSINNGVENEKEVLPFHSESNLNSII